MTYVGFVGVFRGVRRGLSISLNFRPTHDTSSMLAYFRCNFQHILVLIGPRPSIITFTSEHSATTGQIVQRYAHRLFLVSIERRVLPMLTTAVYLNFSEGERIELRSWRPRNIQMPKQP